MNGPTTVPCRVSTASTAMPRLLIRFMIFCCWPTMSSANLSQSASLVRKNVVFPLSPYGVCSTTSVPSPAAVVSLDQLSQESTDVRMLGTLGAPASSPSLVVTILESRCSRSAADGRIRS